MKRSVYLISYLACWLLFSCGNTGKAQKQPAYFEGSIRYKVEIAAKASGFDTLLLRRIVGHSTEFIYKNGNNIIRVPGAISPVMLYRVADNKAYFLRENTDTVYWESMHGAGTKILRDTMVTRKTTVMGIPCDALHVVFENKTVTSYFNRDTLRIDPALHQANTKSGESFYAAKKKALSLKFSIDRPDCTVTYTAVAILPQQLNDSLFAVPRGPKAEWR